MSWWKESTKSAANVSTPTMRGKADTNSEKARQLSDLLDILHFDKLSFSLHYCQSPDDAMKIAGSLANLSISEQGMAAQVNQQNQGPESLTSRREWIDWDLFLDRLKVMLSVDEKRLSSGSETANLGDFIDSDGGALIHYVCACSAPLDIIRAVIASMTDLSLLIRRYGSYMKATPLHLACASGCSVIVFEELLHCIEAESPQLLQNALTMQDGAGRTPLSLLCQGGHDNHVESPAIVQLLLDADKTGESMTKLDEKGRAPVDIAMKYAGEGIIQRLLRAKHQNKIHDVDQDISLEHVGYASHSLHQALRNKNRFQVVGRVAMLLADPEHRMARLNERNNRGQLPIHVAISQAGHVPDGDGDGGDRDILRMLLENDTTGETFTAPDKQGQTPLDVIVIRIQRGDHSVIHALSGLVWADKRRRFFGSLTSGTKNAIEQSPNKGNLDENEQQKETLLDHLLTFLPSDPQHVSEFQRNCLALILLATPPGLGFYDTSIYETKRILGWYRWDDLMRKPAFHDTMNLQMGRRSFSVQFAMDLCMRALLLLMYSIASNRAVDDSDEGDEKWPFVLTYCAAANLIVSSVSRMPSNHQHEECQ